MKKVVMILLIVSGVTLILVAVSINTFPEWLTIPGGLLILFGLAFNTVLDIGNKIKGLVDLLFVKEKSEPASKAQSSYGDIRQQGSSNIVATNIDHLEVYNSPNSVQSQPEINNLTSKQKDALLSLINLGRNWREEFYIIWHEAIGASDILDYDGNPPQISKGDLRALEHEGLLICEFVNSNKAHITLTGKSYNSIPLLTKDVRLRISASERTKDNSPHIEVVVVNEENKTVFCKAKVHAIYDLLNKNSKRDISDYANHFSWSGGADKGSKEIPAGLDGTINLVRTNYRGYGIAFMFDENPKSYWQNEGVYKIDLEIAGAIEGDLIRTEFVGKRGMIEFQYKKDEIHNDYGQVLNNGELKLLSYEFTNQ